MTVRRWTGPLLNTLLLLTGVRGDEHVYSSVETSVILPCNHKNVSNCSSISWLQNRPSSQETIELVSNGNVRDQDQERPGKRGVGSSCSLHISALTPADSGQYNCRLHGTDFVDARVYLSLLNVFSSSSERELKAGSTVTFCCELLSSLTCQKSIRVTWVSETKAPLQGDKYKVDGSQCSSNLSVTLQRSDHNRRWICQLTEGENVRASHSYITILNGQVMYEWIGYGLGVCAVLFLIVITTVICKRRTDNMVINVSQTQGQSDKTVSYAEIIHFSASKGEFDRNTSKSQTEYSTIKTY